jgi:Bacteriophage head to tail connecting protein
MDGKPINRRQRTLARKAALWNERSSWITHWREISDYQQPRAGRFVVTDRNRGDKRANHILDNTAVFGARTLAAGLMSGVTSPARPWFRLEIQDKDLMEMAAVKTWLHEVATILRAIFASSNTYRSLHTLYEELGLFGTAATIVLPDYDNVLHHYPLTVGEYALATNAKGEVDTLCREYQMTVEQMVGQFGLANVSQTVRDLYNRSNYDAWVDVVHLIEPRKERDTRKLDGKNMRFASLYMEPGKDNSDKFLSESGFKRFPALTPRWVVTGNDIYGTSPGMECLGDVKQLQHQQLRKGQAIDYQVNPPLQVPTKYKEAHKARLPGGVFYVDSLGQGTGVRSAYEVNLDLSHLLLDIQDVRERIRSAYYADLFLMLANDTRSGVTATEVAERHEEKLLMLGPVLERLHNELLSPMIDTAFEFASTAGILPPAPKELEGMDLNVEFISVLAQAQRAVATQGMDRLLGTVSQMAAAKPEVLDKLDFDQIVDDYGDAYGVNPKIIVPDADVATLRKQRAAAMAAQQTAATAPQVVESAKTASEINTDNLGDVMNSLMGYNTPGAQSV